MKTLKITLLLALLFTVFTSCVQQDLDEDEVLEDTNQTEELFTGGGVDEEM
ncbi:hypothetical protein [Mangrovimonas aestuarii]|uniref:hypothetical protein n=1 Tax=Mangrovimonas aestuarii TaxID=3018443 RepID=UPI002379F747|nr:hypothetical protein [Mangrovimonas aestuarii]